jgi:DNA-binding NarL/FixJ family response regulator
MEGRTFIRIAIVVACIALTGLGYRNSNGDNSDAVAAATKAACGETDCSASLEQTSRGSFGHEYGFRTERTVAGKKTQKQVIVSCEREHVLIGDWRCVAK